MKNMREERPQQRAGGERVISIRVVGHRDISSQFAKAPCRRHRGGLLILLICMKARPEW